jgi:hypothetical protein
MLSMLDAAPAIVAPRVIRITRSEATVTGGILGDRAVTIRKLLGDGDQNPKTAKNDVATRGLSLLPWKFAGIGNVCPFAENCPNGCLANQGQGPMPSVRLPRAAKTMLWYLDREWFLDKLGRELTTFRRNTVGVAGVRLNMFSDISWEEHGVIDAHPDISWYDYTKNPRRFGAVRPNYWVTYSYDGQEKHLPNVDRVIASGANVSVVFYDRSPGAKCGKAAHRQALPSRWRGIPVIDGGVTDWRPDDPRGVIVGLRLLARTYASRNESIESGFAVDMRGIDSRVDRVA